MAKAKLDVNAQAEPGDSFLVLDLGAKVQPFDTPEDLKAWLKEKESLYSWSNDIRDAFTNILGQFANDDPAALKQKIENLWTKLHLPTPGSAAEDALASLAKENGAIAANLARALRKGINVGPIGNRTVEDILGNAYAMLYLFPPFDFSALERRTSEYHDLLQKLESQSQKAKHAVDDFIEQVNLKPALLYWKEKAERHKNSARLMMLATFAAAIVAVTAFVGLLYLFHRFGWMTSSGAFGIAGIPLTLFAAAVTLWLPRATYKLWAMHNHLKEHANEREAIVHTYLTLLEHDPDFKNEGRAALLAQLFQGGQTGLVHEKLPIPYIPTALNDKV